jgi:phosphoglycolate phosphatase-like HAD superfamily hydrolase
MSNRNVFFDFDGVLVDSNSIKTSAFFDLAMEFFGGEAADGLVENHLRNPGGSRFTKLAWLLSNYRPKEPRLRQKELETEFSALVLAKITAAERASELSSLLHNSDLTPHILSAAPSVEISALVQRFGWEDAFESRIHGSPETKADHLSRLRKFVDLENSIFVGDAPSDLEVAQLFNIPFVFVSEWSDWSPNDQTQSSFLGTWPRVEQFLNSDLVNFK